MILSIIGLTLDLIGVILLFKYGILPNNLWEHILMDNGMSEEDEKNHKIWSKIAMGLLILGFLFQIISSIISNKLINNNETFENINLGNDVNKTTGISGNLKLKFEQNFLFYQLYINTTKTKIDSIENFSIQLSDNDGFKISEIEIQFSPENEDATNLIKKDSVFIQINSKAPFTPEKYSQIKSWDLLTNKK